MRIVMLCILALLLTACGGDDNGGGDGNGNGATVNDNASGPLALEEGQFYVIQAEGAINDRFTSTAWGGELPQRRLVDSGEWWTLLLGGSNRTDATEISLIQLNILKGLEPGTYDISEGSITGPDDESPVTSNNVNVRYPDFEILSDDEEIDGTLTIDSISEEGMSGSIEMTLFGEGGEVQVEALFDVPAVEPLNP